MPTYTFKNNETGHEFDSFMPYDDLSTYLSEHSELSQVIKFPGIVSDAGSMKPDQGFRDVLKRIKAASGRGNTIDTF